jgi:UDP-N-acetylglucosamine 1-carboxyvinyltransferase
MLTDEAGSCAPRRRHYGRLDELIGARPEDMLAITNGLGGRTGDRVTEAGMKVSAHQPLRPLAISTAPYPGFPTDM